MHTGFAGCVLLHFFMQLLKLTVEFPHLLASLGPLFIKDLLKCPGIDYRSSKKLERFGTL